MNKANVETILIKRCKLPMSMVEMDYTTVSGTNEDLIDPIWTALKRLGYTVANATLVTDAEIALVDAEYEPAFLDFAELRLLETILNSADSLVDVSVGPRRESLSQFATRLADTISRKREQILSDHGSLFSKGLESGSFSVATQEDGTNEY